MTPEQFAQWQEDQPDWISQETAVLAACMKDIADFIDYDIGAPIRAKKNGDAMWYVLTDTNGYGLMVLMCTPHAIFTESTLWQGKEIEYSVVTKPLQFLENLQGAGARKLTPDELENFREGSF